MHIIVVVDCIFGEVLGHNRRQVPDMHIRVVVDCIFGEVLGYNRRQVPDMLK